MSQMTDEREIAISKKQFDVYMNEEITDTQQFGHPVKFARRKLYMRIFDFLGDSALFGVFLAGFRAGRWFEHSSPEAAPRVTKLKLNVDEVAAQAGAKTEAGLHVFNGKALDAFASRLLKSVTDRYVNLETERTTKSVELDVDMLVNARMQAMAQHLAGGEAMAGHVPDEKREALAQYLWTLDQKRTHGEVLGKWVDVGGQYRRELFAKADSFLAFFSAMERVVNPYEAPVKPAFVE